MLSMCSTSRPKPVGRAPDVPEARFIPFEVCHPSTAAPRHRGRCPLDVLLRSRDARPKPKPCDTRRHHRTCSPPLHRGVSIPRSGRCPEGSPHLRPAPSARRVRQPGRAARTCLPRDAAPRPPVARSKHAGTRATPPPRGRWCSPCQVSLARRIPKDPPPCRGPKTARPRRDAPHTDAARQPPSTWPRPRSRTCACPRATPTPPRVGPWVRTTVAGHPQSLRGGTSCAFACSDVDTLPVDARGHLHPPPRGSCDGLFAKAEASTDRTEVRPHTNRRSCVIHPALQDRVEPLPDPVKGRARCRGSGSRHPRCCRSSARHSPKAAHLTTAGERP